MKNKPYLPFFVGLVIGAVLIAGFLLLQSPSQDQTTPAAASTSSPSPLLTQSPTAFHKESDSPKLLDTPAGDGEPVIVKNEKPESATAEPSPLFPHNNNPVAAAVAQQPAPATATATADTAVPPAQVPLAFRQLPPEVAAANPQLVDSLNSLQQSFINAIGGPNQNPADPTYYQRWTAAQANIDEQYRILVGSQQFLLEQMQVNNQ